MGLGQCWLLGVQGIGLKVFVLGLRVQESSMPLDASKHDGCKFISKVKGSAFRVCGLELQTLKPYTLNPLNL